MAELFKEETIYINLKYKSELIDAKTVGKVIQNMEGLQREIAKEIGFKAVIYIKSIEYKPHEITIGFLVAQSKM
jgi:hypothetical protein